MKPGNYRFVLLITIFLGLPALAQSKSFSSLNNKANRLYLKGDYQKALELYKKAEAKEPSSPVISYNLGNVGHQQKDFQQAERYYQRALGNTDKKQLADTYYNLGNNYFRQGRIEESLKSYENCLKLNPNDLDAKYNIEFIKRMQKQNQKSEQEKQNEKDKSNQQNKSPENKENQQQKEKSAKQNEKEKQQQEQQSEKEQKSAQPQPKMSKEEAERILSAVREQEKELLKKQERFNQAKPIRVGRDW